MTEENIIEEIRKYLDRNLIDANLYNNIEYLITCLLYKEKEIKFKNNYIKLLEQKCKVLGGINNDN